MIRSEATFFLPSDWYLWLPLYAVASAVNLLQIGTTVKPVQTAARMALLVGGALFLKVAMEGYAQGTAGVWSLDMRERVVREKLGSGLVIVSMLLHLEPSPPISQGKPIARRGVDYGESSSIPAPPLLLSLISNILLLLLHLLRLRLTGMAAAVAVSLGLCIRFFAVDKRDMKK